MELIKIKTIDDIFAIIEPNFRNCDKRIFQVPSDLNNSKCKSLADFTHKINKKLKKIDTSNIYAVLDFKLGDYIKVIGISIKSIRLGCGIVIDNEIKQDLIVRLQFKTFSFTNPNNQFYYSLEKLIIVDGKTKNIIKEKPAGVFIQNENGFTFLESCNSTNS